MTYAYDYGCPVCLYSNEGLQCVEEIEDEDFPRGNSLSKN